MRQRCSVGGGVLHLLACQPGGCASALMPSLMAGSWAGEALLGRPDRADEAREGLRCPVRILACSALALCSLASGLAPGQKG